MSVEAARAAGVGGWSTTRSRRRTSPAMPHHLAKAEAEDVVRRSRHGVDDPPARVRTCRTSRWTARRSGSPTGPTRRSGFTHLDDLAEAAATVLLEDGHEGATYELASIRATPADVAAAAGADLDVITPDEWARTDGAGPSSERVREWLLAMFAYYDRHGLPAGTLAMRALLGRAPTTLARRSRASADRGRIGPGEERRRNRSRSTSTRCHPTAARRSAPCATSSTRTSPTGYVEQMEWGMVTWVVPLEDYPGHLQQAAAVVHLAGLAEEPHGRLPDGPLQPRGPRSRGSASSTPSAG